MIARPELNPIRFYQDRPWDKNVSFSTEDNLPSTVSDQNIGTVQFIQPWATENQITFQLMQDRDDNVIVSYVIAGVLTPIVPTDITPTNWAGDGNYVKLYSYTPTTEGYISFRISEEVSDGKFEYYNSDCILVKETLPDCQRIVYHHRNNTYNTVFIKDSVRVFFPIVYLKATANEVLYGGDKVVSISPSGSIRSLRNSPTRGYVLDIDLEPKAPMTEIMMIMSCSSISLNGFFVQLKDNPEPVPVIGSNVNKVKVNLFKVGYDYTSDYQPVYDIVPPDCIYPAQMEWWFKKSGNTYVDVFTGYTIPIQNGRIYFLQGGIPASYIPRLEVFNRDNTTIQDSNTKDGYDAVSPYSVTEDELSQLEMHEWYNDGYKGLVYISNGANEIIVTTVDKTGACDQAIKEYMGWPQFWLEDITGDILLEFSKYNIINY